jgi:lipoate synthase
MSLEEVCTRTCKQVCEVKLAHPSMINSKLNQWGQTSIDPESLQLMRLILALWDGFEFNLPSAIASR